MQSPGLGIRLLALSSRRLAAAFAGMAVAVVVMFVELGLLLGILDSQALMANLVIGDLVVVDEARSNLHKWDTMDRVRISQIGGVAGVAASIPLYQVPMGLKNTDDEAIRRIVVLAFPATEVPLAIGDPRDISAALSVPDNVLFDRLSRPIYAKIEPGQNIELDGAQNRVAGLVSIGPDIVNDGAIVMSEGTLLSRRPNARPIMGIIRLSPGADLEDTRARIVENLPNDVRVYTPREIRWREIAFTLRSAPIGILFGIGMLAGLVIGSITCYQILFNEIVDRLEQYATLKAMGFSEMFLRRVILEQAILLSWGGFLVGLAASWLVYLYIAGETALLVRLNIVSVSTIFVLATLMSVVAGQLALRRVLNADPAELY